MIDSTPNFQNFRGGGKIMSMLIQHNMAAWNAERQFNIVTKAKDKKSEKLSSGYRINRAADDAAGLSISEKMRRQIRGLKVGTENAEMGISWVQIGEGALNEAHDILHRMNELSIKAQNETNTLVDRAYMEAEFEQLQNELDRISTTTTFNELNIFEEHEPVYDQISGNIGWDYEEYHEVLAGKNELTITYRTEATAAAQTMTISVAAGRYTTHELIDAIDDAFGVDSPIHMELTDKGICRLNLEGGEVMDSVTGGLTYLLWDNYDGGGYGTLIGTTEFLNDTDTIKIVRGQNDSMYLEMEFFDDSLPSKNGTINLLTASDPNEIRLTKQQIMDRINASIGSNTDFDDSGLKASDHGTTIQLSSDKGIVTGFKGNMFKIENTAPIYSSAFYDNIQHGHVWQDPASVVGGAVLTTDSRDEEHNRFYIKKGVNDTLVLSPNTFTNSVKTPIPITIPQKAANANDPTKEGYTAQEMVDELNKIFAATAGLNGEVKAYLVQSGSALNDTVYREKYPDGQVPGASSAVGKGVGDDTVLFEGIEIRTVKEGPDAIVNIDKAASTAYDTLFKIREYNQYYSGAAGDATITNVTKWDENAYAVGSKTITSNITFNNNNNQFKITLRSTPNGNTSFDGRVNMLPNSSCDYVQDYVIKLDTSSTSRNLTWIINNINAKLGTTALKDKNGNVVKDDKGNTVYLSSKIKAEADGSRVKIIEKEDKTLDDVNDVSSNWYTEIELSSVGSNLGYRDIFQKSYQYDVPKTYVYKNGAATTFDISKMTADMHIYLNGTRYTIPKLNSAKEIYDYFSTKVPHKFSDVKSEGETKTLSFTVSGDGTDGTPETTVVHHYRAASAQGDSEERQGKAGFEKNAPAELELLELTVKASNVITAGVNDAITLKLNGKEETIYLDAGTYNRTQLAAEMQKKIDTAFTPGLAAGTESGWGGARVSIDSAGTIKLISRLPSDKDGKQSSIETFAKGERDNSFFDYLNTETIPATAGTKASCTTTKKVKGSFTLTDGVDDEFVFTFVEKDGTRHDNLSLDLITATDTTGPTNLSSLVSRINQRLQEKGLDTKVEAKASGSYLQLVTKEEGAATHVEFTSGSSGSPKPIAQQIFDGTVETTTASITLDRAVVSKTTFTGTKRFEFVLDGNSVFVDIGNWDNSKASTSLEKRLNDAFLAKSLDVEAKLVSGKLRLTKKTPGSGSLEMSYDDGGSVMLDMFGAETQASLPGIKVTYKNNILTLDPLGARDILSVSSHNDWGQATGLRAFSKATGYHAHTNKQGYHSPEYSKVTSVDLSKFVNDGGIELTRWNNELTFEFTSTGATNTPAWKKYSIRLTESAPGTKTSIEAVRDELEKKMNKALGVADADLNDEAKKLVKVLFDPATKKLTIRAAKPGAQFKYSGMVSTGINGNAALDATNKIGGGFFHHVMCRAEKQSKPFGDRKDENGDQFPGDIFAQGRHDLVFDRASLHPNMSDTLILDLNYIADKNHDGKLDAAEQADLKTITLELKPDTKEQNWLTSSDKEVLKTLREQIKIAIENWNTANAQTWGFKLHEDMIEVDIGRHDTGIWGNKDKVSLSFTMTKNPDIATPVEGYFYIDGIRGNAAYETFYYTEGDLIPAFIEGTKDISDGVVLGKDDNELVFLVDGKMEKVDLSKLEKGKKYSAKEIVKAIADEFTAQNLPLAVSISQKGNIRISYKRMGLHRIEQVTGSARDILFFEEHTKKRLPNERAIRVSSNEGDRIEVYSPRFSTAMLGINSICVSTVKNAEKATNRLKEAIKKVADMRTTFGVIQNRIEHTINNNRNKEENTQAAESRIRDADISTEMVDFSNLSIIQQAGQAVLAQANQSRNAMLSLLG